MLPISESSMACPITSLIFDMDNTLFDLIGAKTRACGVVTGLLGVGTAGDLFSYFLRKQGGFEDPENIQDFMTDTSSYHPEIYRECVSLYQQEQIRHITPYPGVVETLRLLDSAGFRMGIVTDAHRPEASLRLEKAGLSRFFSTIITHEVTGAHKPSTLPFLIALAGLNATARETVLVGDSPRRDIAPGAILGMRTVYARYGDRFSLPGNLGGADHVIDEFPEILGIVGLGDGQMRMAKPANLFQV